MSNRSDLTLISENVRNLTEVPVNDWLQVFQSSRKTIEAQRPLTYHDLLDLFKKKHLRRENFLVAYSGRSPSAAARLSCRSPNRVIGICDLMFVPGKKAAARSLVYHILKTGREKRVSQIITWMSSNQATVSDLLGEFLFEPRQIYVRMKATLNTRPELDSPTISTSSSITSPPSLERLRCEGFLQLDELLTMNYQGWTPSKALSLSDGSQVIGYTSHKRRQIGWLMLTTSMYPSLRRHELSLDAIRHVMQELYDHGVRVVLTEVSAERDTCKAFENAGFEVISTLYRLVFEYEYDQ